MAIDKAPEISIPKTTTEKPSAVDATKRKVAAFLTSVMITLPGISDRLFSMESHVPFSETPLKAVSLSVASQEKSDNAIVNPTIIEKKYQQEGSNNNINPILKDNTQIPKSGESAYSYGNSDIEIIIDKSKYPKSYKANGVEHVFTPEETLKFKEIQRKAKTTQEPEVLTIIEYLDTTKILDNKKDNVYQGNKPERNKLPDDIVSPEELQRRGITIIHPDNINFYIRQSAFQSGGTLEMQSVNTPQKLVIVLIDGPHVISHYMNYPQYDSVRWLIEKADNPNLEESRKIFLNNLQNFIDQNRQEYLKLKNDKNSDDVKIKNSEKDLLESKINFFRMKNMNTLSQLREIDHPTRGNVIAGDLQEYYQKTDPNNINKLIPNASYIFSCVGDNKYDTQVKSSLLIWSDALGSIRITDLGKNRPRNNYILSTDQTFPQKEDFKEQFGATYRYNDLNPGAVFRHEARHVKDYVENPRKSVTEYETDSKAMEGIEKAYKLWKDSDYTNDKGYEFIFEKIDDRGNKEYVYTKNDQDNPTPKAV